MTHYLLVRETPSTNTYLKSLAATLPSGTVVYTHRQTAGRGQKGNSWEADPGKNLTFSMLIKRPSIPVREQFAICEAVSIAIVETVRKVVEDYEISQRVKVKWPNDIYCGDYKLCGILIENSLDSEGIAHSVIGVGLNVNQATFMSDAPNPVSLCQLAGHDFELDDLLHALCERIEQLCDFSNEATRNALHDQYLHSLYRADGKPHTFALPDGTQFAATIVTVEPDGMLVLRTDSGGTLRFAFKEVKHVINDIDL